MSCDEPILKETKTKENVFRTTSPDQLYFKNIRSIHYSVNRDPSSKVDVYRLKKFSTNANRPIIYPLIFNNWLEDEVYIFLELNKYVGWPKTLVIRWEKEGEPSGDFRMPSINKAAQLEMAKVIYEKMNAGFDISILTIENKYKPILKDKMDRQSFIMVMNDFLRLTKH